MYKQLMAKLLLITAAVSAQEGPYTLYLPAGEPMEVCLDVYGTALRSTSAAKCHVVTDKGLYLQMGDEGFLASHDGEEFVPAEEFFTGRLNISHDGSQIHVVLKCDEAGS